MRLLNLHILFGVLYLHQATGEDATSTTVAPSTPKLTPHPSTSQNTTSTKSTSTVKITSTIKPHSKNTQPPPPPQTKATKAPPAKAKTKAPSSPKTKLSKSSTKATPKSKITGNKPTVSVSKVPNPKTGLQIVIIMLAAIGIVALAILAVLVFKRYRRRYYQQPSRNSRLRTNPPENTQFENPIQFPPAAYGNAVI